MKHNTTQKSFFILCLIAMIPITTFSCFEDAVGVNTEEWEYVYLDQILNSDKYLNLKATEYSFRISQSPKRKFICNQLTLFNGQDRVGTIVFKRKIKWKSGNHPVSELHNRFTWRFKKAYFYTGYSD